VPRWPFRFTEPNGISPSASSRPGAPPAAEREPAEQILGRALVGRRDDVVIATKSGERRFDPAAGLSRRYIIHQVEHSLRRLGADYIDLFYYAHFPDPDTLLEQTLMVYDNLVRQGKLRSTLGDGGAEWPHPPSSRATFPAICRASMPTSCKNPETGMRIPMKCRRDCGLGIPCSPIVVRWPTIGSSPGW
jgi:hypothetical protein